MERPADRVFVVTGLSGAGKSVVTRCFEDLGYLCVDNLPLELLEPVFEHSSRNRGQPMAVVVDARTPGVGRLPEMIERLRTRLPGLRVVFVDASDESIVRRFSETRRPHPYRAMPLVEAVRRERDEMAGIAELADERIDTSDLTPHELRAEVAGRFGTTELALPMVIRCESFGFRYGVPPDANLVFDVRFLPNPHFVPDLRPKCGDQPEVRDWLEQRPEVNAVFERFRALVDDLVPLYRREQKSYLVIAFGCTGGRHRSVYLAERLAGHLRRSGWVVNVHHRDKNR